MKRLYRVAIPDIGQPDLFDRLVRPTIANLAAKGGATDTISGARLLETTGTVPASDPEAPTIKPATLAEVFTTAVEKALLSPAQVTAIRSALKLLERATGRDPSNLPSGPVPLALLLQPIRPSAIRVAASNGNSAAVTAKRWANAKSEIFLLLRTVGLHSPVASAQLVKDSAWHSMIDMIRVRQRRGPLRPFAAFCHANGIEPNSVTESTLSDYVASRCLQPSCPPTARLAAVVRAAWNWSVRNVSGWPLRLLKAPASAHVEALPLADFSVEFQADLAGFLRGCATGDPFDGDNGLPMRKATVNHARALLVRAASILVIENPSTGKISGLADLVGIENYKTILLHLYKRGGDIWQPPARSMAMILTKVAKDYVRVSSEQLTELEKCRAAISRVLNGRRRPGLTEAVQSKLGAFDDEKIRSDLFGLPRAFYAKADSMLQRNPVRAAQLHETALALDILLKDPIRRGTLAAINIVEHVRRTIEGRITGLFIPGRESKNGIPIETFFDQALAERFERHLTTFRRHIRGASGQFLFPSPDDGPRSAANLAKRLKRTVEDELGVSFNVHLVRHIIATIIFEADPKNALLAQRLLRHTSLAQTETMYGERRSRSAQAQWSAIIENALRPKRPT